MSYLQEVDKRRTFAIISHSDAGKTTITGKVLPYSDAMQTARSVKNKGSQALVKSDWMEMGKQPGISITTSVMQFPYNNRLIHPLDTPMFFGAALSNLEGSLSRWHNRTGAETATTSGGQPRSRKNGGKIRRFCVQNSGEYGSETSSKPSGNSERLT